MKKCGMRVSAFAALFFLACCLYGQVPQADWTAAGDFEFFREGNGLTITKYKGKAAVVNIPPSIDNIPVTAIGDDANYDCSSLTAITIPNSVTASGEWAFSGCSSLAGITIPNSVTAMGEWAFSGCSSLTGITIPNSVTAIGDDAFADCDSLSTADREAIRGRFGDGVF
jgi:hypothetical protein